MSAFIVGHDHIDGLLTISRRLGCSASWRDSSGEWRSISERTTDEELTRIGRMLLAENELSVYTRYSDSELDALPGAGESAARYEFRAVLDGLDAVHGLKMLRCLAYQSCEHGGWEDSESRRFCDALTVALIAGIPGYEEAPWEFTRGEVRA